MTGRARSPLRHKLAGRSGPGRSQGRRISSVGLAPPHAPLTEGSAPPSARELCRASPAACEKRPPSKGGMAEEIRQNARQRARRTHRQAAAARRFVAAAGKRPISLAARPGNTARATSATYGAGSPSRADFAEPPRESAGRQHQRKEQSTATACAAWQHVLATACEKAPAVLSPLRRAQDVIMPADAPRRIQSARPPP